MIFLFFFFLMHSQGFGVTAHSTVDTRKLQPTNIVAFNQADVGIYLREQDTLFVS